MLTSIQGTCLNWTILGPILPVGAFSTPDRINGTCPGSVSECYQFLISPLISYLCSVSESGAAFDVQSRNFKVHV